MIETLSILALVMVLAAFLAWPEISLYALTACLPVIGWDFYWHGFILPLADLVALLALTAFFARFIYQRFFKVAKPLKLKWPLFLPFAIFLLISVISSLLAKNPLYSLWYVARWPLFLYFAYIFLPYNLVTSGRLFRKTLMALALSSTIVLISGYLSLYGQDWQDSFFRIRSIAWFGVFPFGENHNLIAEFLNVGALIFLALREFYEDSRVRRWCDIAFALTSMGIVLTFSRAGWITLALQIIIYIIYKTDQKKRLNTIFALFGIVLIMSPLLWKMDQLQKDNVSSTENRVLLTEISLAAFHERPFLGFGSGEFINLVGDNIRFTAKYGEPIDSHGMLQKVLAENGIFGLAAWLFILAYLLRIGYLTIRHYYRDNPWILPLGLAAAGGLFFQFFNTSYYKGKVWLPVTLFLLAARLLETKYQKRQKQMNAYEDAAEKN
ncbi:MAG: O-antigen ligase family protein [Patescibacteria group bacterium]